MKKDRDLNTKRRENVMNKGPKLYQVVGVTLIALGVFMLGSMAFAVEPAVNNIAGHASFDVASTGVTSQCTGCHQRSGFGAMASDTYVQKEQDFHNTHNNSRWLTPEFNACVNCHKSAAIDDSKGNGNNTTNDGGTATADMYGDGSGQAGQYSANTLNNSANPDTPNMTFGLSARQNVSKALCNRCHGKFTTSGAQGGYAHGTNWLLPSKGGPYNCTACHNGTDAATPAEAHDGVTTIQSANNDNSCLRCHGGAPKFETEETNKLNSAQSLENWTQ